MGANYSLYGAVIWPCARGPNFSSKNLAMGSANPITFMSPKSVKGIVGTRGKLSANVTTGKNVGTAKY